MGTTQFGGQKIFGKAAHCPRIPPVATGVVLLTLGNTILDSLVFA